VDHRTEVARTLRVTHGLGYKRIAAALGANRDQVRSWVGKRRGHGRPGAWHRKTCACGLPCTGTTCDACLLVRHFNRRQDIERGYLGGDLLQTIADDLGVSRNYIGKEVSVMRSDGWPLPYRLPRRV
jgi:hypothetical protein